VEGGIQTSYQYDPQGNLIAEEGRYGTTNCFNRTASIQGAKGGYVQNRYDPEGLRYELLENGKISRFIFSGGEVVTEVDANNSLKAAIVRGHEILAQKDVRDNSYYYLNNAHGDVVNLTDSRGTVVNSYQYDAFGNTVEAVEKVQNRFRYAGEQYDQVTGQYYLRARFYNPVVGRFTQEDTYRGDGLNLYSYVRNNPIKYIDPSGYSACETKGNVFGSKSAAKKGAGGIKLPSDTNQQKRILSELQGLTSHTLSVDSNGYVVIDTPASATSTTPKGDKLIERMVNSDKTCTIQIATPGSGNTEQDVNFADALNGTGSDTIVNFDPTSNPSISTVDPTTGRVGPAKRPHRIGLGHEMIHADRSMRGSAINYGLNGSHTYTDLNGNNATQIVPAEELATVGLSGNMADDITENDLRLEQGLNRRGAY
jgi:RHS repeat-associated protein